MFSTIFIYVSGFVSFFATLAILRIDLLRARARATRDGTPDFKRGMGGELALLACVCGPLPLIAYFGWTRRSVRGALAGLALAAAVVVVSVFAGTLANRLAPAPQFFEFDPSDVATGARVESRVTRPASPLPGQTR